MKAGLRVVENCGAGALGVTATGSLHVSEGSVTRQGLASLLAATGLTHTLQTAS